MENTFWVVAFTTGTLQPDPSLKSKINSTAIFNKFRSGELLVSRRKPRYLKTIDQWKASGESCKLTIEALNMLGVGRTISYFSEPRKVTFSTTLVEEK